MAAATHLSMAARPTACLQLHARLQLTAPHAWSHPGPGLHMRMRRCTTCGRHRVHVHAQAGAPPLTLPEPLWSAVEEAGRSWEVAALDQPLTEAAVAARIHLVGVAHYAPLQDQLVSRVLSQLQPAAVALEMPLDQGGGTGGSLLPYPQVVQVLMDNQPLLAELLQRARTAASPPSSSVAAPPSNSSATLQRFGEGVWNALGSRQMDTGMQGAEDGPTAGKVDEGALLALVDALCDPGAKLKGRVGKDIMDPFEPLGYYAGLELALQPAQAAAALQLFGFAPGSEYATAVGWALGAGAQVLCVDAAVRLQEAWVASAVRGFALRETDLSRRLAAEDAAARALVVPGHGVWEAGLPRAVDELLVASTTFSESEQQGSSSEARPALALLEQGLLQGGPLRLPGMYLDAAAEVAHIAAYKVCRATAAAALTSGAQTERGIAAQAATQPLKFALFESRALHLARQLRELARRNAPKPGSGRNTDGSAEGTAQPFIVAAVVGRQYVPMIRRLWNDHSSLLWRGDVPRTFAPSVVEPVSRAGGELDPDVTQGGSRPVGQKPLNLR